MTQSLSTANHQHFAPLQGQTVTLRGTDGVDLTGTLTLVSEHPRATPKGAGRTAFSLLIEVPAPCEFLDGHCQILHPDLADFPPVHACRIINPDITSRAAVIQIVFN